MIWPTPYLMTTTLHLGVENTYLGLSVISAVERKAPNFIAPQPSEEPADARYLGGHSWPQGFYEWRRGLWNTKTSVEWRGFGDFEVRSNRYHTYERNFYETNDKNPAESRFNGEGGRRITLKDRELGLLSTVDVSSDEKNFYVTVVRYVYENGQLLRQREWKETIPRLFN